MYMDGASNKSRACTGVILRTPKGIELEKAVTFGFRYSNNEAKYEALIMGLQLAKIYGATNHNDHCDS